MLKSWEFNCQKKVWKDFEYPGSRMVRFAFKTFANTMWKRASLVAQMVKTLLAVWETLVRFLGWKDPLEKGMATHSNILS